MTGNFSSAVLLRNSSGARAEQPIPKLAILNPTARGPETFSGRVPMGVPIDPNLGAAAIYVVISCIYLRPRHGRGCRVILALAALILALCAAAKSDYLRNFEVRYTQPPVHCAGDRPIA
jgi:hypothetical protein